MLRHCIETETVAAPPSSPFSSATSAAAATATRSTERWRRRSSSFLQRMSLGDAVVAIDRASFASDRICRHHHYAVISAIDTRHSDENATCNVRNEGEIKGNRQL
jgi:hypothetical protein